jgi:hypothetical protein
MTLSRPPSCQGLVLAREPTLGLEGRALAFTMVPLCGNSRLVDNPEEVLHPWVKPTHFFCKQGFTRNAHF